MGTKRYVSVKNLNLKSVERVEDLEVNSIQDCNIKNKRVIYHLKCKILTNTPELATEGIVKNMVLNTNDPNKNLKRQRQVSSNSSIVIQQVQKRMNRRQSSNSIVATTDTHIINDQYQINSTTQTNTQTESSCSSQGKSNSCVMSVEKMIKMANKKEFPQRVVTINDEKHHYTPTLNFFEFVDQYAKLPEEKVSFKCKICKTTFHSVIGKTGNLNKHLKTHESLDDWHNKYSAYNNRGENQIIDDKTLNLVKYFISSNSALKELKNKWLRELISIEVLPGPDSFRKTSLPAVYRKMREEIAKRLNQASAICLLTDLWCNTQTSDFIGLCAVLTTPSFERELLTVDMIRMPGKRHTAENIKVAIEQMVRIQIFLYVLFYLINLRLIPMILTRRKLTSLFAIKDLI